jgi:D-alanine transaminase
MTSNNYVWFNGEILPRSDVRIDLEDRGYQFADGVYEVIRLYGGRPFALMPHLERLERSAAGIRINLPIEKSDLAEQILHLIERNAETEGMVYLHLTRGCAPRNHRFPADCTPTILFYTRPLAPVPAPGDAPGIKLITLPDDRWKRCWIKSIALLANVLAKDEAARAGAEEAIFIDNRIATECCSSNLFIVTGGTLVTHPVGPKVLPGITRAVLLDEAAKLGIIVEERPIHESELREAEEIFITSTTKEVQWCNDLDGRPVGQGRQGLITLGLHRALAARVAAETGA